MNNIIYTAQGRTQVMNTYTYNVNGITVTVTAPDIDRARCQAKKKAGTAWTPKAKLVTIKKGAAA